MEAFESAIGLNPDFAEAHNNLGTLYSKLGRMDDALACFQRAIDINPEYAEAHRNYSHVLLLQGRFAEGWPEFRWRWHCRISHRKNASFLKRHGPDSRSRAKPSLSGASKGSAMKFILPRWCRTCLRPGHG